MALKRIRFAAHDAAPEAWRDAVVAALDAPPGTRPDRITLGLTLTELTPAAPHAGIGVELFTDAAHLARYEAWLGDDDGGGGPVVVAAERVMRGAEWLERRWREGGTRFEHVAVAVRREGLSRAEFAERWRTHAGSVGAVRIPDAARGSAYVQNSPLPECEPVYDAVTEVWLEDLAALRTRTAWLDRATRENGPGDLFDRNWFLAVREEVL
ncbi:hypothetical protein SAMN05660991_03295 [Trujillonella endophytica]|uniref:EthD domain-containing protein n=2 Tax=Trujillonella endophytica TaxID=673521 RepID=A0A1H8V577_9ACTN|nr:hypothetical protein SAMN05660991_03295 [Trujillella endophytica]